MGSTILRMGLTVLTDLAEAGQAAHESSNNVDSSGIGLAFVPTIVGDGESGVDCSVAVSILNVYTPCGQSCQKTGVMEKNQRVEKSEHLQNSHTYSASMKFALHYS